MDIFAALCITTRAKEVCRLIPGPPPRFYLIAVEILHSYEIKSGWRPGNEPRRPQIVVSSLGSCIVSAMGNGHCEVNERKKRQYNRNS